MSRIIYVAPKGGHFYNQKAEILSKANNSGDEVTFIFRSKGDQRNMMAEINSASPDILITEDLEGFEMCTLTDAVSYNLVHCRQYHYLFSDHPANEKYLNKQLSLVMTFVAPNPQKAELLKSRYPDLPEIIF